MDIKITLIYRSHNLIYNIYKISRLLGEDLLNINELHKGVINSTGLSEGQLFEELRERFRLFLYQKIGSTDDIEEILQETLMTILMRYKDIEFNESFSAWAYNVLKNTISNYFRVKRRRDSRFASAGNDDGHNISWTPDPLFENNLIDCFRELSKTNNRYARVLNFRYQGFSVEEICKSMKIIPNQLYVILSRARTQLMNCMDNKGQEYGGL